jgi:hypothetical protein
MAYTTDKKIGGLDAASSLGATDELVISQAGTGNTLKAPVSLVEAKVFDAKTAITTPTGTEAVVVRQTDNSLRQVALSNIVPAGNITNAKVSASAAIADTKLATISTAGKVVNSATTATSANTINAIVARDGSGNFSAGTITATLAGSITGNATTATTLATGRTIALTGDVTGTTGAFNGSANVSAATTIANDAVTNAKLASGIDASKLTTGTLPIARIADGAVTLAKLVAAVQQSLVPVGAVQAFAMKTPPSGWLTANGNSIGNASSNATHAGAAFEALFTLLWNDWTNALLPIIESGGAASTRGLSASADFAANKRLLLPDLRGYFVRGWGQNTDGTTSGTFGEKQSQSLINHVHRGTTGTDFPGHTHSYNYRFGSFTGSGYPGLDGVGDAWGDQTLQTSGVSALHQHTFTSSSMSPAGGTETRPANIAMLYCIKF